MFVPNQSHLQKPLFSTMNMLPEAQRKRLEQSWAGTFYEEVFSRMDERTFEVLYSDKASRPNVPVNVLVGLEILKAGHGWTDVQMYDHFCFDVQVRYALGYRSMDEGHFVVKSIYNFRNRLVTHMKEAGENLFEVCFEQITDEQMEAYKVKSGVQRTDSKQIMSNIRHRTRLQLLLEGLHRVYRMMLAADKRQYQELLAPYVKEASHKYIYRLSGQTHQSHIEKVGVVMQQLVADLAGRYREDEAYQVLARLYSEHFKTVDAAVRPKTGEELTADSLQSVDDLDATYRNKEGQGYQGYVANVTETVQTHEENAKDGGADAQNDGKLNLITKVQIAPNVTDDAALLNEALPDLAERTALEKMYADGGYNSSAVTKTCDEWGVELHQTAIRGRTPDPNKPQLSDFTITYDEEGRPQTATCPHEHTVPINTGRKEGRYNLHVPYATCPACATRAAPDKPPEKASCILYFTQHNLTVAKQRKRTKALHASGRNPRAAVESTIHELCCRFKNGKLRVRGLYRVAMTVVAAAAMVNARRIWRSQQQKKQKMSTNHSKTTPLLDICGLKLIRSRSNGFRLASMPCVSPGYFSLLFC